MSAQTPLTPPTDPSIDAPALIIRAETTGLFERFLLSAQRPLTIESRPREDGMVASSLRRPQMSSQAIAWLLSCQEARRLLERCPGRPKQESILATLPAASNQALRAARLSKPLLKTGQALIAPALWAQSAASRLLPSSIRGSFTNMGPARRAKEALGERLSRLTDAPNAQIQGAYQHSISPPIHDVLCHGPNEVSLNFPATDDTDDFFFKRSLKKRGWSLDKTRVFIALHEAAHATHALQSPTFDRFFGLPLAAGAADAFASLIWPLPASAEQQLSPWKNNCPPDDSPVHPYRDQFSRFEQVCKNIFLEGYADCFASLVLAQLDSAGVSACARDWIDLRAKAVPDDPDRWERAKKTDLIHDSREALLELVRRCESHGPGVLPSPPGGVHELALDCALRGAARWICLLAQRDRAGPIAASFWRKLEALHQQSPRPTPSQNQSDAKLTLGEDSVKILAASRLAFESPNATAPRRSNELIAAPLAALTQRRARMAQGSLAIEALLVAFGPPLGTLTGTMPAEAPAPTRLKRFSEWARAQASRLAPNPEPARSAATASQKSSDAPRLSVRRGP